MRENQRINQRQQWGKKFAWMFVAHHPHDQSDTRGSPGTSPLGEIFGEHRRRRRIVRPIHDDRRRLADNFQPSRPGDLLQTGRDSRLRYRQATLPGQLDQSQGAGQVVELKPALQRTTEMFSP